MLWHNSSCLQMVNCKVEFPKDHASLLNWTHKRDTKYENGLDLEFMKLIKAGSKSWVTDCKTYLGFKDIERSPALQWTRTGPVWQGASRGGHREPPAWIQPQAGVSSAQHLDLWDCLSQSCLAVTEGANATSLCCLLLTGTSDCFSCLPDKHFHLV